jgi:hypothetical protein
MRLSVYEPPSGTSGWCSFPQGSCSSAAFPRMSGFQRRGQSISLRTRHRKISALLSLLPLVPVASSQTPRPFWQQTNGPEGGYVFALAASRTTGTIFAAVMGGGVYGWLTGTRLSVAEQPSAARSITC